MKLSSLATRLLVIAVLLPVGLAIMYLGGWAFTAFMVVFLGLAAYEYIQLFRTGGYQPSGVIVVGGVAALVVARAVESCGSVLPGLSLICRTPGEFTTSPWLISLVVLLAMTYHLVAYERGRNQAAADFAITLGGIFYIGWLGAYIISLRFIPSGAWWLLLVLSIVWVSDGGAYLVGTRYGRHKLSPRLSPKKTWEGYLGGIVFGVAWALLGWWLGVRVFPTGLQITIAQALGLGLVLSAVPTLGDLGESMIKRQFGAKDSGKLLPGHGGAFDRIDSWLWGAVLGYYLLLWLILP